MFVYIARMFVIIAGPVIGYTRISSDSKGILIGTFVAILVIAVEILIQKVKLDDLIAGGIGVIFGLMGAALINNVFPLLVENSSVLSFIETYSLLISICFSYIGMIFALSKKQELDLLDKQIKFSGKSAAKSIKVIDSSSIIDARILDIVATGFIEGIIVIPSFIVTEVQVTADSPDEEKRQKARRALDIINELKESSKVSVKIYDKDYTKIRDTDSKLVKICHELKAKLITNDFNLNKASQAQGIEVLNVNELSNALKPRLLPGEAVEIFIIKKGKEKDQGIGFLDDGTMVVVDGGMSHIGEKAEVIVKSVLQKPSGRMIFATAT